MDKKEYNLKLEEIDKYVNQGNYSEAARVADSIDWRRVRNVRTLCMVSEIYEADNRYEDSKELLLRAYRRSPMGRTILYRLVEVTIQLKQFDEAIEFYAEYVQSAPNDNSRYILKYKIYRGRGSSLEEQIDILKEYLDQEYTEKWAYELAYLYHRVGLATKCVEECDELILWFGEGKYVMKAMELKTLHQPLSPSQQKKFDAYMMRRQGLKVPEELQEERSEKALKKKNGPDGQEMDIQVKTMDVGKYNTINLQKELAASMQELMQDGRQEAAEPVPAQAPQEPVYAEPEYTEQTYAEPVYQEPIYSEAEYTEPVYQEPSWQPSETVYSGEGAEVSYAAEPAAEYPAAEAVQPAEGSKVEPEAPHTRTDYENYLSQEYDGQIGMVVPEEHPMEKQITGQMNIEDIMREWEKMKRENEEKRKQELRQRVQEQTGALFRDFDETSRKGVLERLQKEERIPVDRRERYTGGVISAHTKIWAAEEVQNAMKAAAVAGSAEKGKPQEQPAAGQPAAGAEEKAAPAVPKAVHEEERKAPEPVMETQKIAAKAVPDSSVPETLTSKTTASETSAPETVKPTDAVPENEAVEKAVPEAAAVPAAPVPEKEPEASAEEAKATDKTASVQKEEQKTVQASGKKKPEQAGGERGLNSAEKRLFASFVPTKGAMKRLVAALDQISLAAYTGNLIITGEPGSDTMELAKNVVKDLKAKEPDFSGKVAKITGSALNSSKKPPAELVEKLAGGALMVEKAGEISEECAGELIQALNQEQWGILIILMDTKRRIRKLLEENPELASCFNARFDVEALDNSTLVAYGCQYAKMQEYAIDELGRLALHTRIEDMQTSDHIVTVKDVREIVDDAIDHAERKTPKHFMDVLLSRRYDDNDMIILHEGDFI